MVSAHDERTVITDRGIADRGIGPGTRLNGIYEIEGFLATGGMGDVYRGRAIETGDAVAIKVIKREHALNDQVIALFRKEAAALHRIRHDVIVHYYVFTTDPDLRVPYMAMEFVSGESLADIVRRGPVPVETVLALVARLSSGMEAAHRLGVIHRDLAPDNIILPEGDPSRAKIIDFGIARNPQSGATLIGSQFAGKLNFASPEQMGLFGGEVGAPSDVYSLALVLAAALAGTPLDMGGTQLDMVRKRQVVPPLQDFDPRIQPLLTGMLAPDPADRPTMAEVAVWRPTAPTRVVPAKTEARSGNGASPALASAEPRARTGGASNRLAAILGLLLVLAGGVGMALWSFVDPAPPPSPRSGPEVALLPEGPPPAAPVPPSGGPSPAPGPTGTAPSPAGAATGPAPLESARPASIPPVAPVQPPAPPQSVATPAPTPPPVVTAPPPVAAPAPPPVTAPPTPPVVASPPVVAAPVGEGLPAGTVRDCALCPQMVEIAGGAFQMGSNGDPTEKPIHRVTVAPFALGRYPVTIAEWRACVGEGACAYKAEVGAPDEPVHNLSATDAQQYVAWLSQVSGRPYRLPTEAEWEYAARGGSTTRYWWGDTFQPSLSACRGCGAGTISSPPAVGRFKPNGFGLHDMTGTVSQWMADCWHRDYRGAPTDGSAWTLPRCRERVLRGGSWTNDPTALGVSTREFYDGNIRYPGNGLRVARDR